MESNRSGLFVYYRWLLLLLASGVVSVSRCGLRSS
jgi:hypothetical protein